MYSLNDVDRLLEIKDYLADGLTIMAIQKIFNKNTNPVSKESVKEALTDEGCPKNLLRRDYAY